MISKMASAIGRNVPGQEVLSLRKQCLGFNNTKTYLLSCSGGTLHTLECINIHYIHSDMMY